MISRSISPISSHFWQNWWFTPGVTIQKIGLGLAFLWRPEFCHHRWEAPALWGATCCDAGKRDWPRPENRHWSEWITCTWLLTCCNHPIDKIYIYKYKRYVSILLIWSTTCYDEAIIWMSIQIRCAIFLQTWFGWGWTTCSLTFHVSFLINRFQLWKALLSAANCFAQRRSTVSGGPQRIHGGTSQCS